jgi:L-lactate dehydrogenase complex protein LldF
LDNGRSAMLQSPLQEALYCIRCGACLNACPVFREIGGHAYVGTNGEAAVYSGPIGSIISPAFFGSEKFANLAHASTLCGACRDACPVGIDLPHLLLEVRGGAAQKSQPPSPAAVSRGMAWGLKIFSWFAASASRFRFAQKLAALGGSLVAGREGWIRLPALTGWGYSKDFPQPARQTFRERFTARPQPIEAENGRASDPAPGTALPQSRAVGATRAPLAAMAEADLLGRFEEELTALGAAVIQCRGGELAHEIAAIVRETGQAEIFSWDAAHLPDGLSEDLGELGIALRNTPDPEIRVGLTGGLAGVAETGSVLLAGGAGRPLLASLLPEIHLVVLRASQMLQTLEQVLQMEVVQQAPASVLVSGPSRTGDIELTLTIGVHGPKRFVVFITP